MKKLHTDQQAQCTIGQQAILLSVIFNHCPKTVR